MKSDAKPEQVKLSVTEAEALKTRIAGNKLSTEDMKILTGLITFNVWLQNQLATAKLSINRLKKLFGFTTEKKS